MCLSFLASEFPPVAPTKAGWHIIPVPLEKSVSYGQGTAQGPEAILRASQYLDEWDGLSSPGEWGFYTHASVDCSGDIDTTLHAVETTVASALTNGGIPVLLGGEHTITLGALRALYKKYGHFGIVHIDAHADLYPIYAGNPYSHACVMYRAVADLGLKLSQYAVRELSREEARQRVTHNILHHDGPHLAKYGLPAEPLPQDFPQHIYISFDVDGLDAGIMPATGTPAPGGLSWYDALTLIERCVHGRRVIGLDVVELAPITGLHFAEYTTARLVHNMMGIIQRAHINKLKNTHLGGSV